MKGRRSDPIAHSVHDRLLKMAASRKEDFNAILSRYGAERLLYRLTCTPHKERFVLKGAAMFVLWLGRVHRPTRDLDLLGSGRIDADALRAIFNDICQVSVEPDGLIFDAASITVAEIREGQIYQGLRVKVRGKLGTAKISVQVDVGLGDAITPEPQEEVYPTLLGMSASHGIVQLAEIEGAIVMSAVGERLSVRDRTVIALMPPMQAPTPIIVTP